MSNLNVCFSKHSTAVKKFSDINMWLRERTPLPIWWSEWYPLPEETEDWDVGLQVRRRRLGVFKAMVIF